MINQEPAFGATAEEAYWDECNAQETGWVMTAEEVAAYQAQEAFIGPYPDIPF